VEEKIGVIVVDIDNDLGTKAKIQGPVVGEEANKKAAMELALADPEDSDANAIMKAVSIYLDLKSQGKNAIIATLTGSEKLGYQALAELSRQLDYLIENYGINKVILVTDGAMDEEIIPMINSRGLKIEGIEKVYVKQSKELEKTYLLLLEKLKDPYYAKYLLGIPALILVGISLIYALDLQWHYFTALIGIYLLMKGFNIDSYIEELFEFLQIGKDKKLRFVASITGLMFLVVLGSISYYVYLETYKELGKIEALFYAIDIFVSVLGVILFLAIGFKLILSYTENPIIKAKHFRYALYLLYIFVNLKMLLLWVSNAYPIPLVDKYVNFQDVVIVFVLSSMILLLGDYYLEEYKKSGLLRMDPEGKEVYDSNFNYIGKIKSIDWGKEKLRVLSAFNRVLSIPFSQIEDIQENRIIIR